MGKLSSQLASCERAISTLDEILETPFSIIVRDASIQRFEYSFESLWKLLKVYLAELEGIVCNSPKRCFREALKVELLTVSQAETCLIMTDDRNLTSHTYIEAVAEAIYKKLPSYLEVMNSLLVNIQARFEQE
jgi:nucleotidyltransferase substrate binding protein (TIGR01987 family)